MVRKPKIVAIFIAYNAEGTLVNFWQKFPKNIFDECILVDDRSKDNTYAIAKKINGIIAYQNATNLGYGGNLKTALSIALQHGADIIVDIHPDNEYKTTTIPFAVKRIQDEGFDLIVGNRFTNLTNPIKTGMHIWKVIPTLMLSFLDRLILGIKITDFHQGFRVYTKNLLERINFKSNSNNYLYSFELIAQTAYARLKVGEVPVETNYVGNKRGASLNNSVRYTLGTFKVLAYYLLAKIGFKTEIFKIK